MCRKRLRGLVGNLGPGELHPGEVRGFDGLPQSQPVNTLLKPVMIRRHNQEHDNESGQREIAAVVVAGSEQGHGADDPGDEDGQTVGGEAGTDSCPACDEAFDSADQPLQLSGTRECRHRSLTILEGPYGVND